VFVQAGVGGLAAAVAEGLQGVTVDTARLLVVEPESAACVARALEAGRPVQIEGKLHTAAEMLACGLASASAVDVLRKRGARSVRVTERELTEAVAVLRQAGGPATTPSGAAGLAGLLHVAADPALRAEHGLTHESCVLFIATEGPVPR
jgi:diaminopropionate ammonia-lyase